MPRESKTRPARQRTGSGRGRSRRVIVIIAIAVALVVGGGVIVAWRLSASKTAGTTTTRTVTLAEETIRDSVGTTGTVEPKHRADLSFASSGTVTSVKVTVGQKVQKGQVLARIDDDSLQADLDAADADYQAAQDDLANLQTDDTATDTQLRAAESKVAVQKSKVSQAKSALSAAALRSTITGTVALVNIAKGDTVGSSGGGASGGSSASSTADITVITAGSYTVSTSVGSADLAKMKKGLQAEITTTGSTQTIYGTVSSVAVMASTASSSGSGSSTATFDVTVDITGSQKSLYAGATATVSIIVKQRDNVLTVPTAAISTVDGKTVVQKLVNGKATPTEITIGQSYGATTEVTKGLAAGDQVVVTVAARTSSGNSSTGTRTGTGNGGFNGGGGFPGGGPGGGGVVVSGNGGR